MIIIGGCILMMLIFLALARSGRQVNARAVPV
jgi:hypothetical protein